VKNKDLLYALNEIDSTYISEAKGTKFKNRRRRWIALGIAAACICVVVGAQHFIHQDAPKSNESGNSQGNLPQPGQSLQEVQTGAISADFAIVQASYPECAPYPGEAEFDGNFSQEGEENYKAMMIKWASERKERVSRSEKYRNDLYSFYQTTMQEFLVNGENINRIYSPLNLYMALSMLTELTDGESRKQILNLLDAPDLSAVRERAEGLWTANYCDDGMVTSLLANSLWMRQGVPFIQKTMQTLTDTYHASSFQGEMGSEAFTRAFHSWLNAQTGGLLGDQVGNLEMDKNTVLELASTIYYSAQWQDRFFEEETREEIFHKADGDISCDFMHRSEVGVCYRGNNFSAVRCELKMSGDMWLFLPEESANVNEVVENTEVLDLMRNPGNWENKIYAQIGLSLPRFDVVSDIDLIEGLKTLGIVDIFDVSLADFSPMCEESDDIYMSEAKHAARITVDEKGCVAAAYTIMAAEDGAVIATEKIDFVLNRPFVFAITGADGTVLFIGVVEEP
jgi:serine protease inhibitor